MAERYLYSESISQFLQQGPEMIWGEISRNSKFSDDIEQKDTWMHEIQSLQLSLVGLDGEILFEYTIPRLGKRIDVVLLVAGVVFVLEYKVGANSFHRMDIEQVWDYALDLKNFHWLSRDLFIAPILIATKANHVSKELRFSVYNDKVFEPICTNDTSLRELVDIIAEEYGQGQTPENWKNSRYEPTPTIIQAATVLYKRKNLKNKSIEDITRTSASGQSLKKTTETVLDVINYSRENNQKSIVFVTGVPGAGKTLVGLNVAIQLFQDSENVSENERSLAVYLSGNGPLVKVLREALVRDSVEQQRLLNPGTRYTKTEAHKAVDSFIMDVYQHRNYVLNMVKRPIAKGMPLEVDKKKSDDNGHTWLHEHVDIFDEAQRSWTYEQLSGWLSRKKGIANFPMSEPEFLTWGLDKKKDWATIVCLVGGGQEINTGEAGISTWIKAIKDTFDNWHVYYPNNLKEREYADGKVEQYLEDFPAERKHPLADLHLKVSMRSFRAENLSKFVKELLDANEEAAREQLDKLASMYPIVLTRDIDKAKVWLRKHARGTERYGLLVSSQAYRLRPLAIDVRCKADTVHWFLDDVTDIRSSMFLEDVATEFDVQGLELDWAGVVWDGDMVFDPEHKVLKPADRKKKELTQDSWTHRSFTGGVWQNIASDMRRMYQINAYRVLLTRARQGMVICVPQGNESRNIDGSFQDPTRLPAFYDGTYEYLKGLGIKEI